jgi:hypothetical protein
MLRMMRYCDKFVPVTNICIMSCAEETGLHATRTAVLVVLGMVRRVDWTEVVVIIRLQTWVPALYSRTRCDFCHYTILQVRPHSFRE